MTQVKIVVQIRCPQQFHYDFNCKFYLIHAKKTMIGISFRPSRIRCLHGKIKFNQFQISSVNSIHLLHTRPMSKLGFRWKNKFCDTLALAQKNEPRDKF